MRSATTLVSAAGSAIGAVARLGLLAIVSAVTASACGGGARSDAAAGLDDAWRVVMNVMTDHRVFGVDPWQTTYAARLGGFFRSQGQYDAEYTLAGMSLDSNHSAGLVAMNATLGFALSG
ncbi:MAG: hypothetical protein JOZ69_15245, partial [Myxococcales bacterium]|nr:hypothetical protein [Myxococcales bacterium]